MVIKENDGKVVILLDQRDIIDYIFDKCGFEVGIEIQDILESKEADDEDLDDEDLEYYNELEETIDQLRYELDDERETNINLENELRLSQKENEKLRQKLESLKKGGKNESTGLKI